MSTTLRSRNCLVYWQSPLSPGCSIHPYFCFPCHIYKLSSYMHGLYFSLQGQKQKRCGYCALHNSKQPHWDRGIAQLATPSHLAAQIFILSRSSYVCGPIFSTRIGYLLPKCVGFISHVCEQLLLGSWPPWLGHQIKKKRKTSSGATSSVELHAVWRHTLRWSPSQISMGRPMCEGSGAEAPPIHEKDLNFLRKQLLSNPRNHA